MIVKVTPDIIQLFDNNEEKLMRLIRQFPYDVRVKVNLYPMRAASGYTIYNPYKKNFTISIHPRLTRSQKQLVLLHEFSHLATILKYANQDIKSHGPEYFTEHRHLIQTIGAEIIRPKDFRKIQECLSITSNYKQFNLCLKANFWSSVNAKAPNNAIFLVNASQFTEKFVFSKKKYSILKKNALYYTVVSEKDDAVVKINKYVKVLPL